MGNAPCISQQLKDVPFQRMNIGTGNSAIYNTVAKMSQIVSESSKNPYIRKWAEHIVRSVIPGNKLHEANAIYLFVRDKTRYLNDPDGMEYLQTPLYVLQQLEKSIMPSLDCDDSTMLSLSLLKSIGFPVAIRIISTNASNAYSHVYGLFSVNNVWYPIDCIKRDKSFLWQASSVTRKETFKVN